MGFPGSLDSVNRPMSWVHCILGSLSLCSPRARLRSPPAVPAGHECFESSPVLVPPGDAEDRTQVLLEKEQPAQALALCGDSWCLRLPGL